MSFIVLGDSAGKLMTGGGIAPFFVAWSRFALGALFLLPFCGLKREELVALLDWRLWLRALFIICAICSILTALRTEPIANVFGGFFISPIVSYFMSAWLLKERISYRRTGLLLFSFLGVLLVVKPGFGMTAGMGFAMLAGCCHGSYLVATRWLAGSFRPRFLRTGRRIQHLRLARHARRPAIENPGDFSFARGDIARRRRAFDEVQIAIDGARYTGKNLELLMGHRAALHQPFSA